MRAGGVHGGFHVETRSSYRSSCVTEKQQSDLITSLSIVYLYSVIFTL